jgi:hypothetical protein
LENRKNKVYVDFQLIVVLLNSQGIFKIKRFFLSKNPLQNFIFYLE